MLKKNSVRKKKRHLQYPEGTVDGTGKTCREVFLKCKYLEDSGRKMDNLFFQFSVICPGKEISFLPLPPKLNEIEQNRKYQNELLLVRVK